MYLMILYLNNFIYAGVQLRDYIFGGNSVRLAIQKGVERVVWQQRGGNLP